MPFFFVSGIRRDPDQTKTKTSFCTQIVFDSGPHRDFKDKCLDPKMVNPHLLNTKAGEKNHTFIDLVLEQETIFEFSQVLPCSA